MRVAIDVDGTLDAAPAELQTLMIALKSAGNTVSILTGMAKNKVTVRDFHIKADYLNRLGCGESWDDMTVLGHAGGPIHVAKAKWCVKHNVDILIDNSVANARAAVAAGVPLVLVPWASKIKN